MFSGINNMVHDNLFVGGHNSTTTSHINMVDNLEVYNGSFHGTKVFNNTLNGGLVTEVGIVIGSSVFTHNVGVPLIGDIEILDNTCIGNVTFCIAFAGWNGNVRIEGNDASKTAVSATFAEQHRCDADVSQLFDANHKFVWSSQNLFGTHSFQSNMVEDIAGPLHHAICANPLDPTILSFGPGEFIWNHHPWYMHNSTQFPISTTAFFQIQYHFCANETVELWDSRHADQLTHAVNQTEIVFIFQDDGNAIMYLNTTNPPWRFGRRRRGELDEESTLRINRPTSTFLTSTITLSGIQPSPSSFLAKGRSKDRAISTPYFTSRYASSILIYSSRAYTYKLYINNYSKLCIIRNSGLSGTDPVNPNIFSGYPENLF